MTELIRKSDALALMQRAVDGYGQKMRGTADKKEKRDWQSMLFAAVDIKDAIAALPAVTVGVKPLVWSDEYRPVASPQTYQIWPDNGGSGAPDDPIETFDGFMLYSPTMMALGVHPTIDAAKATAQADYEARILAALEAAALTPKPVDDSQPANPAIKVLDDDLYDLLAAPDPDDPDALRLRRHGQNLFAQAKGSGWVDDGGEGPLEFLMRRTREVALEDTAPDPACDHCGMDPSAIREAALVEALLWCSAASDFHEDGIARKGWLKLCAPLLKGAAE